MTKATTTSYPAGAYRWHEYSQYSRFRLVDWADSMLETIGVDSSWPVIRLKSGPYAGPYTSLTDPSRPLEVSR